MFTAGEKTAFYMLFILLSGAEVIMMITLLVALKQNLIKHCREWSISFTVYQAQTWFSSMQVVTNLLLVGVEQTTQTSFFTLLNQLQHCDCLNQLVLNETHLLLTISHYWEHFPQLKMLWKFHCFLICFTATLSPTVELKFKQMLSLIMFEILKVLEDWPNLSYEVQIML